MVVAGRLEWRRTALDRPVGLLIVLIATQLVLGPGPLLRWALASPESAASLPARFLFVGTVSPGDTTRALLLFLTYVGVYAVVVNVVRRRADVARRAPRPGTERVGPPRRHRPLAAGPRGRASPPSTRLRRRTHDPRHGLDAEPRRPREPGRDGRARPARRGPSRSPSTLARLGMRPRRDDPGLWSLDRARPAAPSRGLGRRARSRAPVAGDPAHAGRLPDLRGGAGRLQGSLLPLPALDARRRAHVLSVRAQRSPPAPDRDGTSGGGARPLGGGTGRPRPRGRSSSRSWPLPRGPGHGRPEE